MGLEIEVLGGESFHFKNKGGYIFSVMGGEIVDGEETENFVLVKPLKKGGKVSSTLDIMEILVENHDGTIAPNHMHLSFQDHVSLMDRSPEKRVGGFGVSQIWWEEGRKYYRRFEYNEQFELKAGIEYRLQLGTYPMKIKWTKDQSL